MGFVNSKKYDGIQLYHKRNKDISYYIRYKNEYGKSVRIKVGDKSKGITEPFCKQKRDELINKLRLGEDLPIRQRKELIITLNDLSKLYFDDRDLELKQNKRQKSKYVLHLEIPFGTKNIKLLTKQDITSFRDGLVKLDKANNTINGIMILLNAIINYAIKEKGISIINPCFGVKKFKLDNERERFLNTDEIQILLEEIKDEPVLYIFIHLALNTGGRLETVLNIQKKNIDFMNNTVALIDFKNKTNYRGFISKSFMPYLKEKVRGLGINDYVVGGLANKYPTTSLQRKLKKILDINFNKGLDLKDAKNRVVIHTFRHTFASHLAINGTPIFTVQKLLNHSKIEMTLRYAKLMPDSGREFVDVLYI
ncbi:MAG: integrase [Arcobacter sp.]|nr:MAG: integrase [Arcobacter sp.]